MKKINFTGAACTALLAGCLSDPHATIREPFSPFVENVKDLDFSDVSDKEKLSCGLVKLSAPHSTNGLKRFIFLKDQNMVFVETLPITLGARTIEQRNKAESDFQNYINEINTKRLINNQSNATELEASAELFEALFQHNCTHAKR